jgi:polysaccharide export outer membrane protein
MIERQLKLPRAGAAGAFGAVVFCAAAAAVLSGCAEIPGGEGSVLTPQAQAPAAAPAAGDAQPGGAANKFLAAATPGNAGYAVGPQDVLDITVFKAPDLSKTVQVAEDGTINLPLLAQIPAAGKSAAELERDIQSRLNARYMRSPQVTVFVKEYYSQRVTVEGAVKTPGVLNLRGGDTLMQVIARSGGMDRDTASSNVTVFRTANGARTATSYDMSALKTGGAHDPQIVAGDVVVVDDSMAKVGLNTVLKVLPLAGVAASAAMY